MNTSTTTLSSANDSTRSNLFFVLGFWGIIVFGCFFRFFKAGDALIFADEIHTLIIALNNTFEEILTHYAYSNTCMPFTIYQRLLAEGGMLSEWAIRLPGLVSGAMLLILYGIVLKKRLKPFESIFSIAILSFSPYLIFLAREARPYAVLMLTFSLTTLFIFVWLKSRKSVCLPFAAVSGAFTIYLHPVTAPAVLGLLGFPLFLMFINKISKSYWRLYVGSCLLFFILTVIFYWPMAQAMTQHFENVKAVGTADLSTIDDGLMLIHGLPIVLPWYIWGSLIILGAESLFKRYPYETVCIMTLFVLQIAALFIVQPIYSQIPWVFLRYLGHLIPLVILFSICGIYRMPSLMRLQYHKRLFSTLIIGFAVIGLYLGYHIKNGNYPYIGNESSLNPHPITQFITPQIMKNMHDHLLPDFYKNILPTYESGAVVEAPFVYTFPLYALYQRRHGRRIYTMGLGNGFGQGFLKSYQRSGKEAGSFFRTVVQLSEKRPEYPQDARFLIVHKGIKREIVDTFNFLVKYPIIAKQLKTAAFLYQPGAQDDIFGTVPLKLKEHLLQGLEKIYEDHDYCAYRIKAQKENTKLR